MLPSLIHQELLSLRGGAKLGAGHGDTPSPAINWQTLLRCSTSAARSLLPYEVAVKLCVLPLGVSESDGERLATVACPADTSLESMFELRFVLNSEIVVEHFERAIVARAITAAYLGESMELSQRVREVKALPSVDSRSKLRGSFTEDSSSKPIPKLLEAILFRADSLLASDIHLEPMENHEEVKHQSALRLRFRVDGSLRIEKSFEANEEVSKNLIRRVKLLANLDITCDFLPQEGGFSYQIGERLVRLRVSCLPQHRGEKVVLRLLENSFLDARSSDAKMETLLRLGLCESQRQQILTALGTGAGCVLLAGPTGSGKSTLLYTLLEELNTEWRNIISLEDPIERIIPGISQTPVGRRDELAYKRLLPVLLRQDPDVIVLGELREGESAKTALTAAITGHLVLSTVHAENCFGVFTRLFELGMSAELLGDSLRVLVAQRLVPTNCLHCREEVAGTKELCRLFRVERGQVFLSGRGCELCDGTGVHGRRGVFEVLPCSEKLRDLLRTRGDENKARILGDIREIAFQEGFLPYAFFVRELLLDGQISPISALRAVGFAVELAGYEARQMA